MYYHTIFYCPVTFRFFSVDPLPYLNYCILLLNKEILVSSYFFLSVLF